MPKKVGGSLMRVYRDTRFGKDKTPYKTNIGIQFRHEVGKDVHAPGYYLHLDSEGCFIGIGMWHPESAALRRLRERIVAKPEDWRKAAHGRAFRNAFELGGDSLKRPPRGFSEDAPHIEDLKRKDFIAVCNLDRAQALQPTFPTLLAKHFTKATPFMRFLCQAVEVPF